MSKESDVLSEAKERFKLSDDAESENRQAYLDDWRFARMGEQWPENIKRDREQEGRPCLTVNRMPSFIRQVVNDARQNTPQIKVSPMDGQGDPETAEVIGGLIKSIERQSNADAAYDTALDCAVTGGFGYFRVDVDYAYEDSFALDICIKRIVNPLTVYGDPDSVEVDASDWRYGFVTDLIPRKTFEKRYKGAEAVDWDSYGDGNDLLWFQDNTVRIAEYWDRYEAPEKILQLSNNMVIREAEYLKNKDLFDVTGLNVTGTRQTMGYKVKHRVMTGSEILEEKDWAGCYIPICPVYGDEIVIEGRRYLMSMIRQAKDAQRMFNYWRTTSTELVALAPKTPFIGPEGAFDVDIEKWMSANVKTHPFIQYSGQIPPQRQGFAGPPAGALQEAMNASDDIKSIMGLFDASLGARSNETSGRAIMARQREGDVSTFHFIDNLSRAIRYAGKVMVDLIPRVYTHERVVRILGEDGATKEVTLNKQVPGENGMVTMYDMTTGKYDVTVSTGPSFTSKREEASQQMIEMIKVFPQAAPLIGDIVAKSLDWPGADQIAKRLQVMLPPPVQKMEANTEIPPAAQAIIQSQDMQLQKMQEAIKQMQEAHASRDRQMLQMKGENERLQVELANKREEFEVRRFEAQQEALTKIKVKEMDNEAGRQEIALKAYFDDQAMMLNTRMDTFQKVLESLMQVSTEDGESEESHGMSGDMPDEMMR